MKKQMEHLVKLFMVKRLGLGLVLGLSLGGLMACSPSTDHQHPQLTSRDALYEFHCAECHGKDGKGGTVDQQTANLMRQMAYIDMIDYVINEVNVNPDRKMPVFDTMSRSEAAFIIDHVWVLRKENTGGARGQWNR